MNKTARAGIFGGVMLATCMLIGSVLASPQGDVTWTTVVNNNDPIPHAPAGVTFNSYNQPAVNLDGQVVFRARSRGGSGQGPTIHGIYTRDMANPGSSILRILDRTTQVPDPNNLGSSFVETPSFPRIDMDSATLVTRGNHQPVWFESSESSTGVEDETRLGTTGIYVNLRGSLITAGSRLGGLDDFDVYQVPNQPPGTAFEVFPGAPAVTDGNLVVFKGNYTSDGAERTGIFFRVLQVEPAGGVWPTAAIASSGDTLIPGSTTAFGSLSPPSAAHHSAVFAGFDNEQNPTAGGLYLAPLQDLPPLTPLVSIGDRVPGERPSQTFQRFGEGVSFDGRFVGFWGAWGKDTKTLRLYCPTEGNKDRIAFCNRELVCADSNEIQGDPNSHCDETGCYQDREVPEYQGFFVHDTATGQTRAVAKTGSDFDDFLFWNYSGALPCRGGGHSEESTEEDGEFIRWRASAFIAVSSQQGATFKAVFKARTGNLHNRTYVEPVDGIYLRRGPGQGLPITTLLDTTMAGQTLDQEAPADSVITEVGIEREGLRGNRLVINASMATDEGAESEGMAGIYLTELGRSSIDKLEACRKVMAGQTSELFRCQGTASSIRPHPYR